MFSINDRGATIGANINSRGEHHGDELVTAIDIPLEEIMLDERELCALLGEPLAWRALFNAERGGGHVLPLFPKIKPIGLKEKIEEASVTINFGLDDWIRVVPAKIAKIQLEPREGGLTAMSCSVQCTPELTEPLAHLLGKLKHDVSVTIDGGQFGAQEELPLNTAGEGEANEPHDPPDEVTQRRRGRPRKNGSMPESLQ
jgi:hypothetical protein